MPNHALTAQILATCRDARKTGQFVDIDFMLPSVLYYRDDGTEFHFSEQGAQNLFEHYREIAELTSLPLRDVLLWAAQSWDLSGDSLTVVVS
jgi:hypothetical protein